MEEPSLFPTASQVVAGMTYLLSACVDEEDLEIIL